MCATNSRNFAAHGFSGWEKTVFVTIAFALSASGCAQQNGKVDERAQAVERLSVYRELSVLEQSLAPETMASLARSENLRTIVRQGHIQSLSEHEFTRNRRNLAFERLAGMPAPAEAADDFSAFWDIHQAYRHAVDTARYGHGRIGLVYSRPYPGDHLSNPVVILTRLVALPAEGDISASLEIFPNDVGYYVAELENLTRRLDADLAAGFAPPLPVVNVMLAQIEDSPFASADAMAAHKTALNAARAQAEAPVADAFSVDPSVLLTAELLDAVSDLKATLSTLKIRWESDTPPGQFSAEFYDAVIEQTTSDVFTAQTCQANALRYQEDILPRMEALILASETDPNDDAPAALPAAGAEFNLSDRFSDWQVRTPLFPLIEEETETEALPAPPVSEPAPYQSPAYIAYLDAMDRLEPNWRVLAGQPLPEVRFIETGAVPPPRLRYGVQPPPPPGLRPEMFRFDISGNEVSFQSDALAAVPLSAAVLDTLAETFPGTAMAVSIRENREDLPELSRLLPNAAFDLGWPYFALYELSTRGAFEDAPRLEVMRLFRIYQMAVEAEVETRMFAEGLSREDAASILIVRLGMTAEDAEATLNRLSVEPGLRCGELAGLTRFTALKMRAEGVLGARFNIRDFNDVLLKSGSRPMAVVERDVDAWIASQVPANTATELPE